MPVPTGDTKTSGERRPLFRDLQGDDDDPEVSVIESLCVNCEENGTTRLLLTKIPFFKEIVIASFECEHCGFKNNEVQSAGIIQEEGIRIEMKVTTSQDLDRKVVKQSSARYVIPEIDFEAPAFASKGVLTTIEGILTTAVEDLGHSQPVRRIMEPETAAKIDATIDKLKDYLQMKEPFTLILEDIAGNSFLENPFAPESDPRMAITHFQRSAEETARLGLSTSADQSNTETTSDERSQTSGQDTSQQGRTDDNAEVTRDEVIEFQTNCPNCLSPTIERMKTVVIPHFKEVVIMALNCEACGHKTNEVKSGGGIEELGTRITLKITDVSDLSRDILKSDTCQLEIPEIELKAFHGTLGGKFTTVEGLLESIKESLKTINPFMLGDSASGDHKEKLNGLLAKLDQMIAGNLMATIVLDDPVGNSYVQNLYAPDPDPFLTVEKYTRSFEQNEELGLNDMKTD